MSKSKTARQKVSMIAEGLVLGGFILAGGLASLHLLNANAIVLTEVARVWVGYVLAAYTLLVAGYVLYKAVDN